MFQSRPGVARMAALAVAGAGCLTLAACGNSASSAAAGGAASAAGSTGSSASATSTTDPLASLTAAEIGDKVVADAKAASSVTLAGTVTSSGQAITVHLAVKSSQGCTGTMSVAGMGSFKLVIIGTTVYMKPDNQFWKSSAGAEASTVIALVNGRWIKTTTSSKTMGSMAGLCDMSQMFKTNGSPDHLTKGKVTTLNGTRVLAINDTKQGVAYVTDTSTPELVEISAPAGSANGSGKLSVTYNAPVTLTAPPTSQVIDGSQLGI